jgi:ribosomal protein S18 acetylase RimI-like enzyme
MSQIVVRDLRPADVTAGRRTIAEAFAGEPFAIGMFGDSPLDRIAGMNKQYASWPWDANPVAVVAEVGEQVVGVAQGTRPLQCHLCDVIDVSTEPPTAPAELIEFEFQVICRDAHRRARLPRHGHIAIVTTTPMLQGQGVGGRLVDELVARLWSAGAECVLLECVVSKQSFYESKGFNKIDEFDDPAAPGLRSALMKAAREHP